MLKRERRPCDPCALDVHDEACLTRWAEGSTIVVCSCPQCHPAFPQSQKVKLEELLRGLSKK